MKSAIIYYSRSGNTKKVAMKISERFQSDIISIEPKEAYGNYVSALIRFEKERIRETIPEVITEFVDLTKYDVVFIGFPVWGGVMPTFMKEYIKGCNLTDKTVIPFATAGSNGKQSALNDIKNLIPSIREDLYYYTNLIKRCDADQWLDGIKKIL